MLENPEMSVAKLTIVILMLAALLFAVAPNLSRGSCTRRTRESGVPSSRFARDLPRE
jgi:hypothetical protein